MPWTELDTERGDGVSGIVRFGVAAARDAGVRSPAEKLSIFPALSPLPRAPYLFAVPPRAMSVRAGVTKPSLGHVDDAVDVDPSVLIDEFDPLRRSCDGCSASEDAPPQEESSDCAPEPTTEAAEGRAPADVPAAARALVAAMDAPPLVPGPAEESFGLGKPSPDSSIAVSTDAP